jgi:hypothetical protein
MTTFIPQVAPSWRRCASTISRTTLALFAGAW